MSDSTATPQQREQARIERLVAACRALAETADEFLPEYPEAVSEYVEQVIAAVDALGAE